MIELRDWRYGDRRAAGGVYFRGLFVQFHMAINGPGDAIKMNALMRAVPARGVAEVAADAVLFVDAGDDFVVKVEVFPLGDARQAEAAEIPYGREAFLDHPVFEAIDHVFHHAVAVVHCRGAYLNGRAAEQEELGCVFPGCDAADTRERQRRAWIAHHLLHHVESDGLDGGAAVASVGAG